MINHDACDENNTNHSAGTKVTVSIISGYVHIEVQSSLMFRDCAAVFFPSCFNVQPSFITTKSSITFITDLLCIPLSKSSLKAASK